MTQAHIQGPWRMSDCGEWSASHDGLGSSCYQGIRDDGGNVVALAVAHSTSNFSGPNTETIARLIAAAPQLLEALEQMLLGERNECLTLQGQRNLARAAIRAAKGE